MNERPGGQSNSGQESEVRARERRTAVLVDGEQVSALGLKVVLAGQPDLVVETRKGWEAVAAAGRCQPDYIIVAGDGLAEETISLLRELRAVCPGSRLLLFTDDLDQERIIAAGRVPSDSYVTWTDLTPDLLPHLLYVAAHGVRLGSATVVDELFAPRDNRPRSVPTLTENEIAVLLGLDDELDVDEIAERTALSKRTVERALASLRVKFGASTAFKLGQRIGQLDVVGYIHRHKPPKS